MSERPQPGQQSHARSAPCRRAGLRRRPLGGYRYVRIRWRLLFGLIDAVGAALFALLRLSVAALRLPSGKRGAENSPPRRILIIQWDHLGDAILTTGILQPLRRHYPEAQIEVLAAPWNRAVFDAASEVDRVHVCPHNRFSPTATWRWMAAVLVWGLAMRRRRFDLAIDVRGEFPHNVLMWLAGARRRLGWASGGGGFLLTDTARYVANRPETESRVALLECLGILPEDALRPLPRFQPSRAAAERAPEVWRALADPAKLPLRVVLHIGAGTPAKRWPAEHWRTLLDGLAERGDVAVALVGSEKERETARAILGSRSAPTVADWTGTMDIDHLAAVLQRANLLVGADSGPAHLAAAVGTPVLALFSGTNRIGQWRPQGEVVRTLHHPVPCSPCHRRDCPVLGHPCMREIRPAEVLGTVAEMLAEQIAAHGGPAKATAMERRLTR